jgi:hypothetical protein
VSKQAGRLATAMVARLLKCPLIIQIVFFAGRFSHRTKYIYEGDPDVYLGLLVNHVYQGRQCSKYKLQPK